MSKNVSFALTAVGSVLLLASCAKKDNARVYQFHGRVVRIDPAAGTASIYNEKIPGWMDAMTMEYPIGSKKELEALHPGERITGELKVTDDGYSLSGIREDTGQAAVKP